MTGIYMAIVKDTIEFYRLSRRMYIKRLWLCFDGGLKNVCFGNVDQSGSYLLRGKVCCVSFQGDCGSWLLKNGVCLLVYAAGYFRRHMQVNKCRFLLAQDYCATERSQRKPQSAAGLLRLFTNCYTSVTKHGIIMSISVQKVTNWLCVKCRNFNWINH